MELNQLLANGTSECLTKCLVIADGSEQSSHQILTKETENTDVLSSTSCSSSSSQDDFQKIKGDISEIEKSQSKKFKLINQKLVSLEKQTMETNLNDIDTKYSSKFEEIMKEFHSASEFMSHLQSQNETLANIVKEKTEEINGIHQTLNDIKAQSVTSSSNFISSDTQTYDEVCEKLLDNTKMVEALQSLSAKVNAMEFKFNNISTVVGEPEKCVDNLSDDTTSLKLSMEKNVKGYN
uniref:Uncharacterized protein n=2 Tax=Biomphalaria glabrata TaxID=6526 RepID=A0A2C9LJ64_BIOGL